MIGLQLKLVLLSFVCVIYIVGAEQKITDHHAHINSVGLKRFPSACRKNIGGNIALPGSSGICHSLKALKPTGILQMAKNICSEGYTICNNKEKVLQQISWKPHKMPDGCYAFRFGKKNKAAGYGKDCHTNLYFNGVMCCPVFKNGKDSLTKHYLKTNKI